MNIIKNYIITIICIFFIISGCTVNEVIKTDIKPLKDVLVDDIKGMIDDGRLMQSLQNIITLENTESKVPKEDLDQLKNQVFEEITATFNEAIEDKDYDSATWIYDSLRNVGKQDFIPDWNLKKVYLEKARILEQEKLLIQAQLVAMRAVESGELTLDEWKQVAGIIRETRNPKALDYLKKIAKERHLENTDFLNMEMPEKPQIKEMMKGMVTVWVDKGIKLEKGVGYPDRVLGSGFFIDPNGYLLTNYHVISSEVDPKYEGYSRLFIRLSGKEEERIPARVVGYDRIFDIALLKVEISPKFSFNIPFDIPSPELGEKIYAIGSPVDPFLENTLTSGIVSAIGRRVFLQNGDVLQIDAPINPGNSGGPLLDDKGNVIGVVFAGLEYFEGLNFAISFNWIVKILPELYKGNEYIHSWLGIGLLETEKGLEVLYVVPSEPASQIGIKSGDIIKTINGTEYDKIIDIQSSILNFAPDTLIRVTWKDTAGNTREGACALSKRPFSPIEYALARDERNKLFLPLFGMEIAPTDKFLWETNYVVSRIIKGSIADNTGLSVGDPLNIQNWIVDYEKRYAALQVFIKKKKEGFFDSLLSMVNYLEHDFFL
ncbi:MAG: serine protease [Spirochaetales bacterium]|nr:serine protease [Spirochaetales bacterium]